MNPIIRQLRSREGYLFLRTAIFALAVSASGVSSSQDDRPEGPVGSGDAPKQAIPSPIQAPVQDASSRPKVNLLGEVIEDRPVTEKSAKVTQQLAEEVKRYLPIVLKEEQNASEELEALIREVNACQEQIRHLSNLAPKLRAEEKSTIAELVALSTRLASIPQPQNFAQNPGIPPNPIQLQANQLRNQLKAAIQVKQAKINQLQVEQRALPQELQIQRLTLKTRLNEGREKSEVLVRLASDLGPPSISTTALFSKDLARVMHSVCDQYDRPGDFFVLLARGFAYLHECEARKAGENFSLILKASQTPLAPQLPILQQWARLGLMKIAVDEGELDNVADLAKSAATGVPKEQRIKAIECELLLCEAQAIGQRGRLSQANNLYSRAAKMMPDSPHPYRMEAELALSGPAPNPAKALLLARKATELCTNDDYRNQYVLAKASKAAGDNDSYEDALSKAMELASPEQKAKIEDEIRQADSSQPSSGTKEPLSR